MQIANQCFEYIISGFFVNKKIIAMDVAGLFYTWKFTVTSNHQSQNDFKKKGRVRILSEPCLKFAVLYSVMKWGVQQCLLV